MVAVGVLSALRSPGENTESTAPVTTRRPASASAPAVPCASTRELARTRNASFPVTKTTSLPGPVVTTSPAFTSMPSLAGTPLTRTSPRRRWMPFSTEPAASSSRSPAICTATAAASARPIRRRRLARMRGFGDQRRGDGVALALRGPGMVELPAVLRLDPARAAAP